MQHKNRVFVVDDDSSARKGIVRLLRLAGYDVQAFASANDFLDALDTEASGCVVMDARMPGISGDELVSAIKERSQKLSIIVVTGDSDTEARMRAEKIKAVGFFRKPVDGPALLDAIEWALRTSASAGNQNGRKEPA